MPYIPQLLSWDNSDTSTTARREMQLFSPVESTLAVQFPGTLWVISMLQRKTGGLGFGIWDLGGECSWGALLQAEGQTKSKRKWRMEMKLTKQVGFCPQICNMVILEKSAKPSGPLYLCLACLIPQLKTENITFPAVKPFCPIIFSCV